MDGSTLAIKGITDRRALRPVCLQERTLGRPLLSLDLIRQECFERFSGCVSIGGLGFG